MRMRRVVRFAAFFSTIGVLPEPGIKKSRPYLDSMNISYFCIAARMNAIKRGCG